ncbi:MAG: hypothetical protein AMK75_06020 [Planctomycetes bacterium SM23_65]|nr:MAG: hypothetical protein AMK75_06020 [Planctomycetes bacterium SM23_65]
MRKDDKPTVTREDIARALVELGLEKGDCVVVHSSLSSFGYVEGGPGAVVDAVRDVLGPEGTAVFPTFTGSWTEDFSKSIEDLMYTGAIPKAARMRDDFVKGYHPMYSICATGPMAPELVELNDCYIFPSAQYKFLHWMGEHGGKALLLGVDHNSNSSVHLVEEFGDLEYKIQDKAYWAVTVEEFVAMAPERQAELRDAHSGKNLSYTTRSHFNAVEEPLKRQGLIRFGKVGNAELRLMKIADVVRVGLEEVKRDPWFLRDKVRRK